MAANFSNTMATLCHLISKFLNWWAYIPTYFSFLPFFHLLKPLIPAHSATNAGATIFFTYIFIFSLLFTPLALTRTDPFFLFWPLRNVFLFHFSRLHCGILPVNFSRRIFGSSLLRLHRPFGVRCAWLSVCLKRSASDKTLSYDLFKCPNASITFGYYKCK